jgi:hypothetical protein
METRPTQNAIGASINELASFIRENAPIKFGTVCLKKHIAPSTLYGWKKLLLDVCTDIKYDHGVFKVEKKGE